MDNRYIKWGGPLSACWPQHCGWCEEGFKEYQQKVYRDQLETLCRENCESLNDYLSQYKSICDELAAIGKLLPEDRKSLSMLNGLDPNYQMFTTMTLRPPLPEYSELLSMLQSYESRIRVQQTSLHSKQYLLPPQESNWSRKFLNYHQKIGASLLLLSQAIWLLSYLTSEGSTPFVRIEEELAEALQRFKSFLLDLSKACHNAHRCFKRFNKEFKTPKPQWFLFSIWSTRHYSHW